MQTHIDGTVPHTSGPTDDQLVGTEITAGTTRIGQVEGVIRDPLSKRVRRLITSYGSPARRVAVPMEWVVKRSASRLVLGVDERSLDDLGERARR
jgi:PRC-barrel domain